MHYDLPLSDTREAANALAVVVAAVLKRNSVLLVQRSKPPFVGLWGLPGGKIETGEHPDQAVCREVFEETGVRMQFQELCGVVTEMVYDGARRPKHYLVLVCRLKCGRAKLKSSLEGEVRWFSLKDAMDERFGLIPSDRLMLERLVLSGQGKRYFRCVVLKERGRYAVKQFD